MQVGTVAIAAAFAIGNWHWAMPLVVAKYGLRATGQVLNAKF